MTGNPSSNKSKFQTKSASTAHSDTIAVRFVYRNWELEKKKAPKMQTLGLEPVRIKGHVRCALSMDQLGRKVNNCATSTIRNSYYWHNCPKKVTKGRGNSLPATYTWHISHRQHNAIMHALHGNGTKLISKLTTDGMPKLKEDVQDAEGFLSWCLDFRSWTRVQGITAYVVGPLPVRPAAGADARPAWDAKTAEGLRYLCTAILDNDLKSNVASNSENADHVANGPTAYEFLKASMLQRTAEAPAYQQVLDGLRYRIDGNIVSFQSRFTKFANALAPRPAENILCQKYVMAITADTSATFDAEVTTTIAMDDQSDFNRFASKLTLLISQKSTRMSSRNPTPVGQSAQITGNCSTLVSDHDLLLKLQKQVENLEKELKRRQDKMPLGTSGESKCDFKFPNGEVCGGNHPRKNCWYEDPSRCHKPEIRRSIERKIQEKSKNPKEEEDQDDEDENDEMNESDKALYASHLIGEDFAHCTEIVEKPLPLSGSTDAMAEWTCGSTEGAEPKMGRSTKMCIDTSVKEIGGGAYLIVDTGASNHIIYDQRCILHPEKHTPVDIIIKTGNGFTKATSQGPASFTLQDAIGGKYNITRNVIFCPEFKVNLFSPQREYEDFGTSISYEDVCCLHFLDDTVVPFSDDNYVFKLPYTSPSTSSGVSSNFYQPQDPKTGFHSCWEHMIAPAVYHTLWEQLLLNQDQTERNF